MKKNIYNKRRKEISVFFDLLWVRQTSVRLLNYSSSVLYQKIQQGILITPEPGYSYDWIIGQVDVSAAGSHASHGACFCYFDSVFVSTTVWLLLYSWSAAL